MSYGIERKFVLEDGTMQEAISVSKPITLLCLLPSF